jgi:oligosaccharide reducing-end xylanase
MPDYANFDGSPFNIWNGGHNNFMYDAWRVASNIAINYAWFAKDKWEVEESNKLLNFFYSKEIGKYHGLFKLDREELPSGVHNTGLIAMNAAACLASTNDKWKEFLEEFWNTPIPEGRYRYYDGML